MKTASEELLKYLLYDESIVKIHGGSVDLSTKNSHGTRGWFFWSKERYESLKNSYDVNNYALLDNGLLVTYGVYSISSYSISAPFDAIYLGKGVYHFGIKGSSFKHDPPECCYK
jgi:hypothetical protein